jgi:hypothetical protein
VRSTFPLEEPALAATSEPMENIWEMLVDYFVSVLAPPMTAWAADSRAMGTR